MTVKMILRMGAISCCIGAGGAMAQEGPPPGALPPGVLAQINLGQAGLLRSFYSDEQWGTTQGRIGQSRSTVGIATSGAPGAPTSGFEDGSTDIVLPVTALKALPDGKSYLRFGTTLTLPNGEPNLVEQDAVNLSGIVQYITFPDPNTMFSVGAFAERFDVEESGASPSTILRDGVGIRGDILRKFNDHWGIATRAEYSWGETKLNLLGPGIQHIQGDDRFYTQTELVGTYQGGEGSIVPGGWALHPIFGFNYRRDFLEATADSTGQVSSGVSGSDTEDYGMAWAMIGLEQQVPPGQWSFNASVGLEHEYVNDLDAFVDESNYVVGSVGASFQERSGNRIDLGYTRHQGLNGNRWNQTLQASFILNF